MIVSTASVRDYLQLNDPNTTSSQYSDATISSNILAAQEALEHATGRFFTDRTFTTITPYVTTTMLRAVVRIPGFRSFTTVTFGGSVLVQDQSFWALPDIQQTGVFTGMQFRAFRADNDRPWWLADPAWWDKGLDNPFYPGNLGGGYAWSSMPNDLSIVGSAGYAANTEPYAIRHAVKVLAAFYTMRPASILADVAITPQGGVLTYSQMPAEVRDFIRAWNSMPSAVSVG